MSNIMSDEEKKKENFFEKCWKDFTTGIEDGFKKLKNYLEQQAKKNEDLWDTSSAKTTEFFSKTKEKWDEQVKKWDSDLKKMEFETKEQWDSRTQKIKKDIEEFQEKTRDDFSKGMKTISRGFLKGYFYILLLLIPIIVIVVIIMMVFGPLLR